MPRKASTTDSADTGHQAPAQFAATSWTAVVTAQQGGGAQAQDALAKLCQVYWGPLHAYVRRLGHAEEEAKDLTQQFFYVLLSKNYLGAVDRRKGKFRTFLLTAMSHFLANEWDRIRAQKRGRGQIPISLDAERWDDGLPVFEPATELSPLKLFERSWASTVLRQAIRKLQAEQVAADKQQPFAELCQYLEDRTPPGGYEESAQRLKLSVGAVRVAVLRLRHRLAELVRAEVARTLGNPTEGEIEREVRHLFVTFGQ